MSEPTKRITGRVEFHAAIIFIIALLLFTCKLGYRTLWRGDEALFTLATQGLWIHGSWWLPYHLDHPFLIKPPFKLWLDYLAVTLLGESPFSYRIVDALAGAAILAILYLAAIKITASRMTALLAVLVMIGMQGWVFLHGPRYNSLDVVLVLFCTLSLYWFWLWRSRLVDGQSASGFLTLSAIACGLAIFTKTAAGVVPLIVIVAYILFSREFWILKKREVLPAFLAGIVVALPYFLYHSIFTPAGFRMLIVSDVFTRVKAAYWESEGPLFYINTLVFTNELVTPLVFIPAVLLMFVRIAKGHKEYLFLTTWALLPVILFSFASTRALWYIAAAFPAVALVTALFFSEVLKWTGWSEHTRQYFKSPLKRTFSYVALILALSPIFYNVGHTVQKIVTDRKTRLPFELFVYDVLSSGLTGEIPAHIRGGLAYRENIYANMLHKRFSQFRRPVHFRRNFDPQKHEMAVVPLEMLQEVSQRVAISRYYVMPPLEQRDEWNVALIFGQPQITEVPFGENRAFGFSQGSATRGGDFGLLLAADAVERFLGVQLTGDVFITNTQRYRLSINDQVLNEITLAPGQSSLHIELEPLSQHTGRNLLTFKCLEGCGSPIRFERLEKVLLPFSVKG